MTAMNRETSSLKPPMSAQSRAKGGGMFGFGGGRFSENMEKEIQ